MMPPCAHAIVLHQETFFPNCTALKICQNQTVWCQFVWSDSRNLNQHWLMSHVEPDFLLASVRLYPAGIPTPQSMGHRVQEEKPLLRVVL